MNTGRTAAEIGARFRARREMNTAEAREVRREYSRRLQSASARSMYALARELITRYRHRWFTYELILNHKEAVDGINSRELEFLGQGINSWWTVDSFGRTLAGPAWRRG